MALYSIDGRLVKNMKNRGREFVWNGAGYPAGIYLLKVCSGKGVLQKRLFLCK
jgi:hypothetical protein